MSSPSKLNTWKNKALIWEVVGLFSILIIEIVLTYNRVLYGVDIALMSLPADGAYRIFSGQVPSRDFYTPAGFTLFYILADFFHILGGFSFKAIALYSAVTGAIGTVAVFLILRLYLGGIASLGFATITALTLTIPRPHPWLDETAILFYLFALAAFSFAYRYRDKLSPVKTICLAVLCGLALTASIFQKHNLGLTALAFTSPLWLFVPFGKGNKLINRVKGFAICLLSTLFSIFSLTLYFESHGNLFADISQSAGLSHRLVILLPNIAIKVWLMHDWGKIVFVLYITIVTLFAGFSYLLNLNLKEIFKERGLLGAIISLMAVSYIGHLTSESGGLPALELSGLSLGLVYAILSKLKESPYCINADQKKLSNFCLITGIVALTIFLLWQVTYQTDFPDVMKLTEMAYSGRTKATDIAFLAVMLIVAVILFTSGFLYRKTKNKDFSSTRRVFIGSMIFVILLAISPILYYEYHGRVYRTAMARLLMPVLRNTGLVQLVEYKNIPALNGFYADKKTVKVVEEFVSWFRPKIDSDPSLKDGTGIYIFPQGTALYGILGVESFRNVYLWLSHKLTFNQLDPDTDEIIKKSPKFIIMYLYGNPFDPSEGLSLMPRLQKILQEDYVLTAKFGDFLVFQRTL